MAGKMPRAIVDLDSFVESDNIMVFGDTGAGKTELVASLPGKVLILSSESGTRVVKRALERAGLPASERKRFKVWRIRSWQDLEDAYAWARDNQGVFDWIVIDSATSVQNRSMRAAMEAAVKRNPEKRDVDLPDRGEHQKVQNAMKRMVTDFCELDCNTLWLAQAMRREDQDGNEIVVPFIFGKDYEVSAFVCAQMMAFGYYMKKQTPGKKGSTDRVLIWESFADKQSNINYWSKDRYDAFPKVCLMSSGEKQLMTLGDILALIDNDARSLANKRVDEADDEVGPDGEDIEDLAEEADSDEDVDDDAEPEDIDSDEDDDADEDDDEPARPGDDDFEFDEERRAELMAMAPKDLKVAVEACGFTVAQFKGVDRADIVQAVLEKEADDAADDAVDEAADAEDDDDDLDLEGMVDEDEDEEPEPEPEPVKPARSSRKTTAAKPVAATKTRRMRAV